MKYLNTFFNSICKLKKSKTGKLQSESPRKSFALSIATSQQSSGRANPSFRGNMNKKYRKNSVTMEQILKATINKDKKTEEIEGIESKKNELILNFQLNEKLIKSLESKIQDIKIELKRIKSKQVSHYHAILQKGKDSRYLLENYFETRIEGLSWVIKAIWYLGEEIDMQKLPKFLDPQAIEYLFNVEVAKIEMKINELQRIVREKRRKSRNKRIQSLNPFENIEKVKVMQMEGRINIPTKEEIIKRIHRLAQTNISIDTEPKEEFLNNIPKAHHSNYDPDNVHDKKLQQIVETELEEESFYEAGDKKVDYYEKELERLKLKVKKMRSIELDRITQEFLFKKYQEKYNITQAAVISAIAGVSISMMELEKHLKAKDAIRRKMKMIRTTFNFSTKATKPL